MLIEILSRLVKGETYSQASLAREIGISEAMLDHMEYICNMGCGQQECSTCSKCSCTKSLNKFKMWTVTKKGLQAVRK